MVIVASTSRSGALGKGHDGERAMTAASVVIRSIRLPNNPVRELQVQLPTPLCAAPARRR